MSEHLAAAILVVTFWVAVGAGIGWLACEVRYRRVIHELLVRLIHDGSGLILERRPSELLDLEAALKHQEPTR